jgi:hypothetical protein
LPPEYPSLPGVEGAQLHPRVTPASGIHCKVARADSIKSECSKIHLITPEEQPGARAKAVERLARREHIYLIIKYGGFSAPGGGAGGTRSLKSMKYS